MLPSFKPRPPIHHIPSHLHRGRLRPRQHLICCVTTTSPPHRPVTDLHCGWFGCTVDLDDVTYYVGHETVVSRDDGKGLPVWQERWFALMERNAIHVSDFFSLPTDQVVEIGRQISI